MSDEANKEVREARRRWIVRVLERNRRGLTVVELLAILTKLHKAGKWPQAEWAGARNEPYATGLRQTLYAMRHADGAVVEVQIQERHSAGYRMWVCRWFTARNAAALAQSYLPGQPEVDAITAIAQDYMRQTGLEVAYGVTPELGRVVRIGTARGVVDHDLEWNETWEAAARRVLLEEPA